MVQKFEMVYVAFIVIFTTALANIFALHACSLKQLLIADMFIVLLATVLVFVAASQIKLH